MDPLQTLGGLLDSWDGRGGRTSHTDPRKSCRDLRLPLVPSLSPRSAPCHPHRLPPPFLPEISISFCYRTLACKHTCFSLLSSSSSLISALSLSLIWNSDSIYALSYSFFCFHFLFLFRLSNMPNVYPVQRDLIFSFMNGLGCSWVMVNVLQCN